MMVTAAGVSDVQAHEHRWEDRESQVFWTGLVYVPGLAVNGPETLKALAGAVRRRGVAAARSGLRGAYFLVVRDKSDGRTWAFGDPGGLRPAFRSDDRISTSFLALVDHERLTPEDLGVDTLMEYLNLGLLYENRTFFRKIRRIRPEEALTFGPGGALAVERMEGFGIDEGSGADVETFFEGLAASFRGWRVGLDLTGGTDSRLLAVLLDHSGVDFEPGFSGWTEDLDDAVRARQVAGAMGKSLTFIRHDLDGMEERIQACFRLGEGLVDPAAHELSYQHFCARRNGNADVVIQGDGGELYKDFWWMQDFPFYRSRTTRVDRLVSLRILQSPFPVDLLRGPYAESTRTLAARMRSEMSRYVLGLNTQSYDNIYYRYRTRATCGTFGSLMQPVVPVYAPLLELDLVRTGFALPRSRRFFDRFHRDTVTRLNPRVAGIPTIYAGLTVSSRKQDLFLDGFRYVGDRGRRLLRMALLKLFRTRRLREEPRHPEARARLRRSPLFANGLRRLTDHGILESGVSPGDVPDWFVGRVCSLGMLLSHLESDRGGN